MTLSGTKARTWAGTKTKKQMGARVGRMFLHAFAQQDLAMCLFVTASVRLALHGKSAKKRGGAEKKADASYVV